SAFTRVTACTLALSPIRDTHSEGFSYFVTSTAAPVASGWSGCRVGLAPTGKRRLVTAHTPNRHQAGTHPARSTRNADVQMTHGRSKRTLRRPTRWPFRGRVTTLGDRAKPYTHPLRRGSGDSMYTRKAYQHGRPHSVVMDDQPDAREGQAERCVDGGVRSSAEAGQRRGREGTSVQDERKT